MLAAAGRVNGWWLAAPLTGLCLWSVLFGWHIRRSGLTPGLVLADAGLMAVVRGGARQADAIVAASLEVERRIRAEDGRQADEREQHRQLCTTPSCRP